MLTYSRRSDVDKEDAVVVRVFGETAGLANRDMEVAAMQVNSLKAVKFYPGGRKIDSIPSISEILSQMCYYCVQYTRRHLMSPISHS